MIIESRGPHLKETYPDNILYLADTAHNREKLCELIGESKLLFKKEPKTGSRLVDTYLIVDLDDKTWRDSPEYMWLYRNNPPIADIETLKERLNGKEKQ